MNEKYVKFLLNKNKNCYDVSAERFSNARKEVWNELKFLFKDFLKSGDKTLDLGCGNGRFFELIKNLNAKYTGADNSEKLIKLAKVKYPEAEFVVSDADKLPFSNESFDKVYAIALFHHIPSFESRLQAFKEVNRVLKKDGIFVLTAWNMWKNKKTRRLILKFGLLKILRLTNLDFKDILMPWHGSKDCYFHNFSMKELEKLAEKAGFKIIKRGEVRVRKNHNFYLTCQKI